MSTLDRRDEEALPEGWQYYERILPSQIKLGSQIKVITQSGSEFVFAGTENGFVKLQSTTSDTLNSKEIGNLFKTSGGIIIGRRMNLVYVMPDSNTPSGLSACSTNNVKKISACHIEADQTTEETERILASYFGNRPQEIADVLSRARTVFRKVLSPREIHTNAAAPEVIDVGGLYERVTAAILELFQKAHNLGDDEELGEIHNIEEIGRVFERYVQDYGISFTGPVQNFEAEFVLTNDRGEKRRYKMTAGLYRATNTIGHFKLELLGTGLTN